LKNSSMISSRPQGEEDRSLNFGISYDGGIHHLNFQLNALNFLIFGNIFSS
jgi:hypothetical protein